VAPGLEEVDDAPPVSRQTRVGEHQLLASRDEPGVRAAHTADPLHDVISDGALVPLHAQLRGMIRKLKSGAFRLYSRKKDPRTGKRKNLGTFKTLAAAKRHERAVQFFKRH